MTLDPAFANTTNPLTSNLDGGGYTFSNLGKLGIGTTTPVTSLDIVGSTVSQLRLRTSESDATNKSGALQVGHYTNIKEDACAVFLTCVSASNTLNLGGGSASLNAITAGNLYAAANTTTLSGSTIARWTSTGIRVEASVSIAPNASAILDIYSTTQGLGLPAMTTTQRNAVSSPRAGLAIYNSTTNKINFYNGTAWEAVTSA